MKDITVYKVYTDGATSKNGQEDAPGGAAFACWLSENEILEQAIHIDNCTNNKAELMAALMGCVNIENYLKDGDMVEVYSDSAYVVNCYKDKWYEKWRTNDWKTSRNEPVKNKGLWEMLIHYFDDPRYSFYKVKGHANDFMNNYVDNLAVKAKERTE